MALLDCVVCGTGRPRMECCVLCEQPKWPQRAPGSNAEVEHDWPACVNPECEAYGEPKASAMFLPASMVASMGIPHSAPHKKGPADE